MFCRVEDIGEMDVKDILILFREEEGLTLIINKELTDNLQIDYTYTASWITLDAVGLTAVFSKALADKDPGCNVVAACNHDHIFVDSKHSALAMKALEELSA